MNLFLVRTGSRTQSVPSAADRQLREPWGCTTTPLRSPHTRADLVNRLMEHRAVSEASGTSGLFCGA